jgi:hypothetical protein
VRGGEPVASGTPGNHPESQKGTQFVSPLLVFDLLDPFRILGDRTALLFWGSVVFAIVPSR